MKNVVSKFYAVVVGRKPGVYNSWEAVKPLVASYPAAIHKSFPTLQEAINFYQDKKNTKELPEIMFPYSPSITELRAVKRPSSHDSNSNPILKSAPKVMKLDHTTTSTSKSISTQPNTILDMITTSQNKMKPTWATTSPTPFQIQIPSTLLDNSSTFAKKVSHLSISTSNIFTSVYWPPFQTSVEESQQKSLFWSDYQSNSQELQMKIIKSSVQFPTSDSLSLRHCAAHSGLPELYLENLLKYYQRANSRLEFINFNPLTQNIVPVVMRTKNVRQL